MLTLMRSFKNAKNTTPLPIPPQVWQHPGYFIAFGLGSGTLPFAPGTWGTLLAIPFYLLIQPLHLAYYIGLVALFIIASSVLCSHISKAIHLHDHPGMCIDEFVGFFVTMIAVPPTVGYIVLGFLLFRFFDIVKPWPINWIDKNVAGGWGMILDDVVAGGVSCLILQLIQYFAA